METKPLLYGLSGFFLGGLLASVAATTFDKPADTTADMSMSQIAKALEGKQGDEFDEAFISGMIEHHEGAVEMAELAAKNAKHEEIKKLSEDIIMAQKSEIDEMKRWRAEWGYTAGESLHDDNEAH